MLYHFSQKKQFTDTKHYMIRHSFSSSDRYTLPADWAKRFESSTDRFGFLKPFPNKFVTIYAGQYCNRQFTHEDKGNGVEH